MNAPRIRLARLPTPLHRLDRLSDHLGEEIWIKRDDLTGFAEGGNKVRKAEFLLADARERGADVVLTAGAVQSNHARVIAAAASCAGTECHLVLSGIPPTQPIGNLLLDRLSGAVLHFVETGADRVPEMERLAEELRQAGRRPYVIPIGGSNVVGARGYVDGFKELDRQVGALPPRSSTLFFATSSGGTYGGLLAGRALADSDLRLIGVRVDADPLAERDILLVSNGLAEEMKLPRRFDESDLSLQTGQVGEGYGIPTPAAIEAISLLWRLEGILLDPVYTGKAMAGLLAAAKSSDISGHRTIFLHTGGAPSVHASPETLRL